MQQNRVVCAFADGVVEFDIQRRLMIEILLCVGTFHVFYDPGQEFYVGRGCALCGKGSCYALYFASIFEIVISCASMPSDQVKHRLAEYLADDISDKGATAVPAQQQAALFQRFDCISNGGPGDIHLLRQIALPRKPVSTPQKHLEGSASRPDRQPNRPFCRVQSGKKPH